MRHSDSKLRIAVLGATGATGRHVVATALQRGHQVRALTRRPRSFSAVPGLTQVVWTDLADQATLGSALTGADLVISALGGATTGPTTVCTDAVRSLVPAMNRAAVNRLIVLSAHGVAETHGRSLYALAVWARVADRMRDKESMEAVLTASDLDWTIVRPSALSNKKAVGRYQVAVDLPIRLWSSIGRADLAGFLVHEAEQPRFLRALPRIAR